MIALKTILKEIDPYAFDEALKLTPAARKGYRIQQTEEDRHTFDDKWAKLNNKLVASRPDYEVPAVPFKENALIRDFNPLYAKIYDKEKYVNL